jgi:hypothetical protein
MENPAPHRLGATPGLLGGAVPASSNKTESFDGQKVGAKNAAPGGSARTFL